LWSDCGTCQVRTIDAVHRGHLVHIGRRYTQLALPPSEDTPAVLTGGALEVGPIVQLEPVQLRANWLIEPSGIGPSGTDAAATTDVEAAVVPEGDTTPNVCDGAFVNLDEKGHLRAFVFPSCAQLAPAQFT
jgi:hypothetical protein